MKRLGFYPKLFQAFSTRRIAIFARLIAILLLIHAATFAFGLLQDSVKVSHQEVMEANPYAYLETLIKKCGELCTVSGGDFSESVFFKKRDVRVSCEAIFSEEVFISRGHELKAAPEEIPEFYLSDYTLNGRIPIMKHYFDQIYLSKTAATPVWEKDMVEGMISLAHKGELSGNYGTDETNHLRNGLLVANGVQNGRVLVIGSEHPWVEATVLSAGASEIVTLEYGQIISKHPSIVSMTPGEFRDKYRIGTLGLFDAIVTFSSVEHSGLGRYGDALNPWGDVLEIARAHCVCKRSGSLVIAVMTEDGNDALKFNAHRVYGDVRWPYLASNWHQVHREPAGEQRVHVFVKQ